LDPETNIVTPSPRSITRTFPLTADPRPRSEATSPGEGPGAESVSFFEEKRDDVELHAPSSAAITSAKTVRKTNPADVLW
jgi:hypothetical protein